MKYRICGGALVPKVTELSFKVRDSSIVILKSLPVLHCNQCGDAELEHGTILKVEKLLERVDLSSELKVIRWQIAPMTSGISTERKVRARC